METALTVFKETPIPNLLVAVGAVMLVLSIVGRFGTYIEVPAARQRIAGLLGGACIVAGLAISYLPADGSWLQAGPVRASLSPDPAPSTGTPRAGFEGQVAAARAGCFVTLGSFRSRVNAETALREARDRGLMAEMVATSDYPWLSQGLFKVVIGAPDTRAAAAMVAPAREIVRDAILEPACPQ